MMNSDVTIVPGYKSAMNRHTLSKLSKRRCDEGGLNISMATSNDDQQQQQPHEDNSDFYAVIDVLKRENERLIKELAGQQQLLDLFDDYRAFSGKHFYNCICSGRDHFMRKWKQLEKRFDVLSPKKYSKNSNHRHYNPNVSTESSDENESNESNASDSSSGVTLQLVDSNRTPKRAISQYLESLKRTQSTSSSGSEEPIEKVKSFPFASKKVMMLKNGMNMTICKRNLSELDSHQLNQLFATKKAKTSNQISIEPRNDTPPTPSNYTDKEVERLDRLNNVLDQLLMGRYEALNKVSKLNHSNEDIVLDRSDDDEAEDQAASNQEDSPQDQDKDEVIFLDEVDNKESETNSLANDKTATRTVKPTVVQGSTILSAALKSGFKPYPNYQIPVQVASSSASEKKSVPSNPIKIK